MILVDPGLLQKSIDNDLTLNKAHHDPVSAVVITHTVLLSMVIVHNDPASIIIAFNHHLEVGMIADGS